MILSDHVVILTVNNCVRNTCTISSDRAAGRLVLEVTQHQLVSVIPIPCLKLCFFNHSNLCFFSLIHD